MKLQLYSLSIRIFREVQAKEAVNPFDWLQQDYHQGKRGGLSTDRKLSYQGKCKFSAFNEDLFQESSTASKSKTDCSKSAAKDTDVGCSSAKVFFIFSCDFYYEAFFILYHVSLKFGNFTYICVYTRQFTKAKKQSDSHYFP